jgi:ATP-dependent RNA helicase DDX21
MHGDIAQNQREVTMKRFKEGKFKVLVATDVASRGLDIPNIDLVIQIEPPREVETYIHRSGRTARAGASGTCVTFYTTKTKMLVEDIERQAGIKLQRVGIPQPEDVIRASATGILTNLEHVHDDVLPMFEEAASKLIEQHKGDYKAALCKTLAYISGHYKSAMAARSLLTGQEHQLTMKMFPTSTNNPNQARTLDSQLAREFLDRWWPGRLADSIRVLRTIKNKGGAVFDINEDQYDRFMDTFTHI